MEDFTANFLKAKADLEDILTKGGIPSKVVNLDKQTGISVHLTSGTLVYSIGQLQENPKKYFQEQREAHWKCASLLEWIQIKSQKVLKANKPSLLSYLNWRILGKTSLVKEMHEANVELALYNLIGEAAAVGNFFLNNFPEYIATEKEKHAALFDYYLSAEKTRNDHAALLRLTEQIRTLSSSIVELKHQNLTALGKYLDKLDSQK